MKRWPNQTRWNNYSCILSGKPAFTSLVSHVSDSLTTSIGLSVCECARTVWNPFRIRNTRSERSKNRSIRHRNDQLFPGSQIQYLLINFVPFFVLHCFSFPIPFASPSSPERRRPPSAAVCRRPLPESQMPGDVENPKPSETNKSASTDTSSASEFEVTWYRTLLQQASIYGVAAGYCLSASLLSIINKWAVMKFPYPGALTALQYFTSAAGVFVCGWLKLVEHDPLDLMTMWRFLPAAIIFYLSLFTNSELLLHANVDTFIVFRSAVPIFVAIGETLFLHQPWPSLKTWASLATIFGGSVIYVLTDYQFTVMAYAWACAYLVSMTVDFVYIKHVVMTIGLNTWGLVLYNNLEALLLFPLELLIMGELKKIEHEIADESEWHSFSVILPVGLSCLFGLSISFFGFSCRKAISATGFTVLGIVNKLLTVVINLVIWDKHSTFIGTVGLLICMLGGVLYQQSTSNKPKPVKAAEQQESNEEVKKLLEMQTSKESDNALQNQGGQIK